MTSTWAFFIFLNHINRPKSTPPCPKYLVWRINTRCATVIYPVWCFPNDASMFFCNEDFILKTFDCFYKHLDNVCRLFFHTQPPQMSTMGMMNPPTMMYTQPVMRPPNPFGSVSSAQVGVRLQSGAALTVSKHFSAWVNWCIYCTVTCAILWCVSFNVGVRVVEDDDSFNYESFMSWRRQKKLLIISRLNSLFQ